MMATARPRIAVETRPERLNPFGVALTPMAGVIRIRKSSCTNQTESI